MIYVMISFGLLAIIAFCLRVRSKGLLSGILDIFAASVLGWVAGILIGLGARAGMWSIPFFNGVESRATVEGTLQVVLVFSLYGIGLALLYELLFRELVRNRGLIFGLMVTLVTAYPLSQAALQQLTFQPPLVYTLALSLFFIGLMFIPFALLLEVLIAGWHRFSEHLLPSGRGNNAEASSMHLGSGSRL